MAGAAAPQQVQSKAPKSRVTALVGKVVDADNKPASGAEVRLDSEPRTDRPQTTLAKTKTAKDGTFRIERVPPGKNYVLSASLRVGNLTAWGSKGGVNVVAGQENDAGVLKLNPPAPSW